MESLIPLNDWPSASPGGQFAEYAEGLARLIYYNEDRKPLTVGIFGGYGSGKTTLMYAIAKNLHKLADQEAPEPLPQEDTRAAFIDSLSGGQGPEQPGPDTPDDLVLVLFEAWRHDHEKHLFVPFLANLATHRAFRERADLRGWVSRALQSFLSGLSLTIPLFGLTVDSDKVVGRARETREDNQSELERLTSGYVSVPWCLKNLVAAEAGKPPRRIVVFIDDLDRCMSRKAFALLEAIKSFMNIPGFTYVIGLDARAIKNYVVEKYNKAFVDPDEYLEKMIQVPFRIPSPAEEGVREMTEALLKTRAEKDAWAESVLEALADNWGALPANMRKVKRILNLHQLISACHKINGAVPDATVLLGLLAIQSRWPEAYALMGRGQGAYHAVLRDPSRCKELADGDDVEAKALNRTYLGMALGSEGTPANVDRYLAILAAVTDEPRAADAATEAADE
jgi:hypothetical protein